MGSPELPAEFVGWKGFGKRLNMGSRMRKLLDPFLQSFSKQSRMSSVQLSGAGVAAVAFTSNVPRLSPTSALRVSPSRRSFRSLVVKAATVVTPKYTSLKPLGDRVLVKLSAAEEKTIGGILLPSSAQTKPQGGEIVAVGAGRTIGDKKVEVSIPTGSQVVYSKYAGTEVDFDGSKHLIMKEDDIIGILETDDVEDMKPLNDRVLIKVAEASDKTAGGLILTETTKEKPSIGTVVAVGPGPLDEEGKRQPLAVSAGSTVMYSKYAGGEFKGADGTNYIVLKASDVMAELS